MCGVGTGDGSPPRRVQKSPELQFGITPQRASFLSLCFFLSVPDHLPSSLLPLCMSVLDPQALLLIDAAAIPRSLLSDSLQIPSRPLPRPHFTSYFPIQGPQPGTSFGPCQAPPPPRAFGWSDPTPCLFSCGEGARSLLPAVLRLGLRALFHYEKLLET